MKDLLIEKFNEDVGSLIFEYITKPKHIMCDVAKDYQSSYLFEIECEYFEEDEYPFLIYCHLELGIIRESYGYCIDNNSDSESDECD